MFSPLFRRAVPLLLLGSLSLSSCVVHERSYGRRDYDRGRWHGDHGRDHYRDHDYGYGRGR